MPARPLFSATRQTVPTPEVQYEPQFSEAYNDPLANPYDSWDQNAQPLPSYDESMSPTEAYRDEDGYNAGPSSQALVPQSTQLQPVPAPWVEGGRSPYLVPYDTHSKHSVVSTFSDEEDPNNALLGLLNDYDSSELHHPLTEVVHPDMSDPLSEEAMRIHYGRIPQRQPRRSQTVRRIQLQKGHLVLECPVAPKLLGRLPIQEGREFTHMRYTAVTCDPDDFARDGYTLRSVSYVPPRKTELCIVLTMYNEDERLFVRTMHGVMQNIAYLCKLKNSRVWGPDGWKRITVCLVADGRHQVSSRTLSVLATMGVYQEGVAKNSVRGQPVEAHLYEYTAQISVDHSMRLRSKERGIVPVQIVLCIKEHNRKKINSHRWCFNAFGPILEPNIYILLDVGTRPRARSIYRLWNAFERDRHVGGACGEIVALKGRLWHGLVNPLVAAQNFEYKMSNILDKPMESAFGYINVLPGAFSAYRYEALKNDEMGNGPLCSYFKGEKLHGGSENTDVFTSNMYLAEDRILCWELVTKRDSAWILRFVKLAQAETDVPSSVPEFIAQRRRWLNGSFFAAIHSIIKFGYLYRSNHSKRRKFFLHLEMLYQTVQLLYSWFSLANYYIAFCILTDAVFDSHHWAKIPIIVCQYIYVIFLLFCYLLSMGNRPAGNRIGYLLSMIVFALLMMILMACTAYLMYASVALAISKDHGVSLANDPQFVRVFIALLSTYGVWLIASLLFFDPWHLVTSIVQYMLLTPSMVNIINIYAFCNTHDVSWGTKGSDKVDDLGSAPSTGQRDAVDVSMPTEAQDRDAAYDDACHVLASRPVEKVVQRDPDTYQKDYYAMVRTNVVLVFTLTNGALAIAIVNLPRSVHGVYMGFLFYSVAALAIIRLLGAIVYLCSALKRR
ncbi:chitin synthase [Malassezia psittaci]|uniref:Chitin synthase n=1 Tax=Malassezia psittaci TaxID=1821823 RepID=A0AAF0FC33_9BASI|nr:chitin synthase [Malassezia psittaci]